MNKIIANLSSENERIDEVINLMVELDNEEKN